MAATRSPSARGLPGVRFARALGERASRLRAMAGRGIGGLVVAGLWMTVAVPPVGAAEPLRDEPVIWHEDDRRPTPVLEERDPNLLWDMIHDSVVLPVGRHTRPDRLVRRIGTLFGGEHVPAAANVNALDEVPNSAWFTNRIGLYPLSAAEAFRGAAPGRGPDCGAPYVVTRAKTQGVTPGFVIRDGRGDSYLIKFDPPGCLGQTTRAGVVSARILHAAGYNVPNDNVVTFSPEDLRLDDGVTVKLQDGSERPMTINDLDLILAQVEPLADGRYLAIASQYVAGRPIGCYDFRGRRRDDPNDRIDHENRREQRGLRLFAAWLHHYDTKQHNTLDAYVPADDGAGHYVRHYLIDFASTLGTGAAGAVPRYGWEYTIDLLPALGRALALGLHEDPWRRLEEPRPNSEIGYWESEWFDPQDFKPMQPNSAFANLTHRDGYWAAKIISAFRDEHLRAMVGAAGYRDPAEEAYVVRVLAARRDKIARTYFDRIPPLDFFTLEDGRLWFRDLGVERGIYPERETRYRWRLRPVNENRAGPAWPEWTESECTMVEVGGLVTTGPSAPAGIAAAGPAASGAPAAYPFLSFECQVQRGDGWSRTTRIYISRARQAVIALER